MTRKGKGKRLAVFDVDGTIFRSSLFIALTERFIEEGIFPKGAREMYARVHEEWLNREGTYEEYLSAMIVAFAAHIAGVRYTDIERISKELVAIHKGRVYRYTRDLVRELKEKGYHLLAISHSPKLIVDPFCATLGFTSRLTYGMMFDVSVDGTLSGVVQYKDLIYDKEKIVERAIKKEQLTLEGSVGVGDTESDIPFLKMVTRPICFNPNQTLYDHAKRKRWPVVVERKDVIYRM